MLVINLLGVEVRAGKYRNNVRGSELMLTVLSSFPQVIMVQSKYSTNGIKNVYDENILKVLVSY